MISIEQMWANLVEERKAREIAALPESKPELPDPEVYARPVFEEQATAFGPALVPASALGFYRKAHEAGANVVMSYARGPLQNGRVVSSILVRARFTDPVQAIAALWLDHKFEFAYQWTRGAILRLNSEEMKAAMRLASEKHYLMCQRRNILRSTLAMNADEIARLARRAQARNAPKDIAEKIQREKIQRDETRKQLAAHDAECEMCEVMDK